MSKFFNKILVATAAAIAVAQSATAQTRFQSFDKMMDDANTAVTNAATSIINFASILIGVVAVVMLIWNFVKRSKGDQSSNDALASWGFGLLFAALGLQVVRFIFFGL